MLYDTEDHHEKYLELENQVNSYIDSKNSEFFKGYNDGIKLAEEIIKDPEVIKKASITVFSDWYNYFHK